MRRWLKSTSNREDDNDENPLRPDTDSLYV